jgi:predicted nucleotidyltransferase
MPTRDEILQRLREFKKREGSRYGIVRIGLFGSYAKNEANEQSDIDVFVELQRTSLITLSRLRLELEALLERHVDLVQLRERMNPYLKAHIENEAVSA